MLRDDKSPGCVGGKVLMAMAIAIGVIVPLVVVALAALCGWYWAKWADGRRFF